MLDSHIFNMLMTSLIISASFHVLYFDKNRHPWHHHFWVYFGTLFFGGICFAWFMYLTEPTGFYG